MSYATRTFLRARRQSELKKAYSQYSTQAHGRPEGTAADLSDQHRLRVRESSVLVRQPRLQERVCAFPLLRHKRRRHAKNRTAAAALPCIMRHATSD